jgi:hypothetical protein
MQQVILIIVFVNLLLNHIWVSSAENANVIAEERLTERWGKLAEDKLSPLIARVTDQVFLIRSTE